MRIDPALFQENERTAPTVENRRFANIGSIGLHSGGELEEVTLAYETWGEFRGNNAVLVCHALSGDSHCIGWWSRLVGPGKVLDPERFFVIGTNALGGCQGSTGPSSPHPADGRPYGSRFPKIAIQDMVAAQLKLLESLGISKLALVAGGSMGGMQALEWTVQAPDKVERAFVTASTGAHSAMQIGFNEAARQAILRDPKWAGGDYPPEDGPVDGLSVARMIGHLSFLSEGAFAAKFGRNLQQDGAYSGRFQIESYLSYQGDKFAQRFDANSLIALMNAIDAYELTSLAAAKAKFLFCAFTTDWLYPVHQSEELHRMALSEGKESELAVIDLPMGHDAFLLDGEIQAQHLARFLEDIP